MATSQEHLARWFAVEGGAKRNLLNSKSSNIITTPGAAYSYGHHFPLVEALKDKKGETRLFLLNGDRSTVTTSKHQAWVREEVGRRPSTPHVIIPFSALAEAGIIRSSIQVIEATGDWIEKIATVSTEQPDWSEWRYIRQTLPGTGVIIIDGEREYPDYWSVYGDASPQERADYQVVLDSRSYQPEVQARAAARIQVVPRVIKNLGQRTLSIGHRRQVELLWDEERSAVSFRTIRYRHRLGESVIRAKVQYMTKEFQMRERWAYFLSGFDMEEARPAYFLAELPAGARPTTVAEAYEALKPAAVKAAEAGGREVSRQGDIFAISMPGVTLSQLKAQGGVHHRRSAVKVDAIDWAGRTTARSSVSGESYVVGTNHTVTDVVRVGKQTWARGTMRHEPIGREPDHARIRLGDGRTWHLIMKNTVPTAGKRK